ncbi:4-hydroxy-tetrahydrodipicolinate synthase [Maricaulis virginensis]|uniref:4-hydroxy-tetrahydrodipicolinate synthase n=1 Tax=Maricaulis virginensis TaxID=144022 RepID=A0A9W6IL82_9PROT|nr:4-hydroxy-tetrahydrodipicolinate synthase [Maricaulis virginensis]GLK51135.1 4-hydroxy-tetrahydrodipicolinate synthase [Maricaulis virginensis]
MFKGSITALVTPFKNGAVDEAAVAALAERQIEAGSHGLVPCGTTGENATLTFEEHMRVVEIVVETARGRVPVIAGTGSNNTAVAIQNQLRAKELGADAGLIAAPYYNKPNAEGLYQHYKAINDAVDLPIVVYNVPGRTVIDIQADTVARIATLEHVVGIKDATGDVARVTQHRRLIGTDFVQLSGDDPTALGYNATGGVGAISVTSNVAPALCAQFQAATLAGDWDTAREINDRLLPLHHALFTSASPGPTKYAMSLLGVTNTELRLPLTEPDEASKAAVREAMVIAGLLDAA